MAYFSNGSEGYDYEAQYCRNCVHYGPKDGPGCPVWGAHLLFNYDQGREGNEKLKTVLGMLIPTRIEDGFAAQCSMFIPERTE